MPRDVVKQRRLTIRMHARLNALVQAAVAARHSLVLVDDAGASVLADVGVTRDDGPSEERLATEAGRNAVVIAGGDVGTDGARSAFRDLSPVRGVIGRGDRRRRRVSSRGAC